MSNEVAKHTKFAGDLLVGSTVRLSVCKNLAQFVTRDCAGDGKP